MICFWLVSVGRSDRCYCQAEVLKAMVHRSFPSEMGSVCLKKSFSYSKFQNEESMKQSQSWSMMVMSHEREIRLYCCCKPLRIGGSFVTAAQLDLSWQIHSHFQRPRKHNSRIQQRGIQNLGESWETPLLRSFRVLHSVISSLQRARPPYEWFLYP